MPLKIGNLGFEFEFALLSFQGQLIFDHRVSGQKLFDWSYLLQFQYKAVAFFHLQLSFWTADPYRWKIFIDPLYWAKTTNAPSFH